ncbi:MAG: Flp pilus assembly protein CpaB [Proteobacteria bacterium]|nr:Flp pilus assembly protein CpaB [Pseudomonadota bacterium]
MRFKDIVGLSIALVLAIGVAFLTRFFLTRQEAPKKEIVSQQQQLTQVLVAAKNFQEGDKIKSGDLIWQKWPLTAINQNYVTPQTLSLHSMKLEDLTGSIVRESFSQGEPIIIKELVKKGERSILAAVLDPGKRAISIDVSPTTASSGLISPGDIVDIILSFSSTTVPEGAPKQAKSTTLLEGIKVLAIDTNLATPDKINASPHVATLEVTPAQAEILVGSVKEGVLSLSLHSLEKTSNTPPTSEKITAHNTPEETKVTIIRGKETSTIEFNEDQ